MAGTVPAIADAFALPGCDCAPAPLASVMAQAASCSSSCSWMSWPSSGPGRSLVMVRTTRPGLGCFPDALYSGTEERGLRWHRKAASEIRRCGMVTREHSKGGRVFVSAKQFSIVQARRIGRLAKFWACASSADIGAGNYREENGSSDQTGDRCTVEASTPQVISSAGYKKQSLQAAGAVAILIVVGAVSAVVATLTSGGPGALVAAIAKSGFSAAFALIFVSEIGDKTFFIAALLAMRHSRGLVLLGASGALGLMTVISVVIGRLCQKVPQQLQTSVPIGEYAAVALLIWFGLRSIRNAYYLPSEPVASQGDHGLECGELAEAEEFLKKSESEKKVSTPLEVLTEAFSLVFVAEWGDRSMLATVALGAAQSPWGVATGAIAGHVLATALAVLGGAFLAEHISEKLIGYIGGFLFLVFAGATLLGAF